jgi:hypothetical protein
VRFLLAGSLLLMLVAAPAAEAKLPAKGGKSIVPGRSIGGVKLGMDATAAVKKWGKGGSCDVAVDTSCRWDGTMRQGRMRFEVTNGKVSTIVIEAGQQPSTFEPVYSGPITKWKTKKGVRLGTTLFKVAKKYPRASPDGGGLVLASGTRRTYFASSGGRTASITITAG